MNGAGEIVLGGGDCIGRSITAIIESYVTWDFDAARVEGTLKAFSRTVAKIEGHQFSNAKVKKCARLCDGCDMRFYCRYK